MLCTAAARRRSNPSHTPPQTSSLCSVSPAHQKQTARFRAEWKSAMRCSQNTSCLRHGPFPIFISCSRGMCMMLCLIATEEEDKYRNGSPPRSTILAPPCAGCWSSLWIHAERSCALRYRPQNRRTCASFSDVVWSLVLQFLKWMWDFNIRHPLVTIYYQNCLFYKSN